jgi:hypothetical protein
VNCKKVVKDWWMAVGILAKDVYKPLSARLLTSFHTLCTSLPPKNLGVHRMAALLVESKLSTRPENVCWKDLRPQTYTARTHGVLARCALATSLVSTISYLDPNVKTPIRRLHVRVQPKNTLLQLFYVALWSEQQEHLLNLMSASVLRVGI